MDGAAAFASIHQGKSGLKIFSMNISFWNIRGVKKEKSITYLKDIIASHKLDILCLAEPLIAPPSTTPEFLCRLGLMSTFFIITFLIEPEIFGSFGGKWSWEIFGNLKLRREQVEAELEQVLREQEEHPFNVVLQHSEIEKEQELNKLIDSESEQWRHKARIEETFEGDRNTSYFHAIHKLRLNNYLIMEIKKSDGTILKQQHEIKQHVVSTFQNKYQAQYVQHNEQLLELIPKLISEDENAKLTNLPIDAEVKDAMFSMDSNSSLGPDGFQGIFFQTFWNIMGPRCFKGNYFLLQGYQASYGEQPRRRVPVLVDVNELSVPVHEPGSLLKRKAGAEDDRAAKTARLEGIMRGDLSHRSVDRPTGRTEGGSSSRGKEKASSKGGPKTGSGKGKGRFRENGPGGGAGGSK
ncbi:hypothetical protein IFM89_025770 [Coptis chinensis]|uniref:Endonuclease/exonuclease/phosphatase domain-containing protein n=1 Tax=Coptis chinensis TaxID=261450 RepID=A0A835HUX3_9MAGN|nr:hypothetical protein IFM89_025770 [Coptis chinensis]